MRTIGTGEDTKSLNAFVKCTECSGLFVMVLFWLRKLFGLLLVFSNVQNIFFSCFVLMFAVEYIGLVL